MRLLDQVNQATAPFLVRVPEKTAPIRLFGAADIAAEVRNAPVRYVCEETVTKLCARTALDVPMLERCLDLLHIPAPQLWVEWDEGARESALGDRVRMVERNGVRRAGMTVQTDESGRRGRIQTCWESDEAAGVVDVSPVVIEFDLDDQTYSRAGGEDHISVTEVASDSLRALLRHTRFRVRDDWLRYYKERCDSEMLQRVLLRSAQCVLHDFFFSLALTLLLEAAGGPLTPRDVDRELINRKRIGGGKPALLDHLELVAHLGCGAEPGDHRDERLWERQRRLHVVRGHLVRRGTAVFWRKSHWRGDAVCGLIASRTTTLREKVSGRASARG